MGRLLRAVAAVIALVAGLAFHVRNHGPLTLDLYVYSIELPVSWLAVGALSIGAALGALAMLPARLRMARLLRRQSRELALLRANPPAPGDNAPHGH